MAVCKAGEPHLRVWAATVSYMHLLYVLNVLQKSSTQLVPHYMVTVAMPSPGKYELSFTEHILRVSV